MTGKPSDIQLLPPLTEELPWIKELYCSSFPVEERRPWSQILAGEDDDPKLQGIYRDGCIAGLLTTWDFPDFIYVEHLAVDPALRGSGIGSKVLGLLQEASSPIVLEAEPPTLSAMAERRIEFYRRAGFVVIDPDYIQPPYAPGLDEVPLWLLSTSVGIDPANTAATIRRKVYRAQ